MNNRREDVQRIEAALAAARDELERFTPGAIAHRRKAGGDPITEADEAVNAVLLELLPRAGEGWFSEESADDASRLRAHRVWIVDPLDGTQEFVDGIPEWCVSVGLIEDGRAVAGGVTNPAAGETIVGSIETGVTRNGAVCRARSTVGLAGAEVLASRSEVRRGEWERFQGASIRITPMGSVAYKLARVAAGLADATWTLVPKHEWDVAGGAALVLAAGGVVWVPDGSSLAFNRADPLLPGLAAAPASLASAVRGLLSDERPGLRAKEPGPARS